MYKLYGLYEQNGTLRYIGYTSKSLKERLKAHLQNLNSPGRKCHRLCWLINLRDRGEKPIIRELDKTESLEKIKELEIYWIATYRGRGINLVNSTKGGDGAPGIRWTEAIYKIFCIKVCQYTKDGKLVKIHKSLSDASFAVSGTKRYNGKISGVCNGKRGRRSFKGFIFRYDGDPINKYPIEKQFNVTEVQRIAISKRQSENNVMKNRTGKLHPAARSVVKCSLDGKEIEDFDTLTQANKSIGSTSIGEAIKSNLVRGGFKWKYK